MPLIDSPKNLEEIELSIVIPAFNEEKRLLKTIGKIISVSIPSNKNSIYNKK